MFSQCFDHFQPISLEEMDSVKLMDRLDTKFVVNTSLLPQVLNAIANDYRILTIKGIYNQEYHTIYFDTEDYAMYRAHQNGRVSRYKIRYREYVSSRIGFLEIKYKNNKRRTEKRRIAFNLATQGLVEADNFLHKHTPFTSSVIKPQLIMDYVRVTLVQNEFKERVTIDYLLSAQQIEGNTEIKYDNICIIEIKRDKALGVSPVGNVLQQMRLRPFSISKYCLSAALLNQTLKQNNFKQKIKQINKIQNCKPFRSLYA